VLVGGLLQEVGQSIASHLGVDAEFLPQSRKRVEEVLLHGDADILCYMHPDWLAKPKQFRWTHPVLTQVERVLVPAGSHVPENFPEDLKGHRIVVQLGYHYDNVQALFSNGQAHRVDMTDVPGMFRVLEMRGADAMISSEAEIEGYFKNNPGKRPLYSISATAFSEVHTQCAVSPKSRWSVEQIDKAIVQMREAGEFERLGKRYGLSLH
jgi:ABC-type amino acid transport substrate-binding protein